MRLAGVISNMNFTLATRNSNRTVSTGLALLKLKSLQDPRFLGWWVQIWDLGRFHGAASLNCWNKVDTTGVWCATRHLSLFTILEVQEVQQQNSHGSISQFPRQWTFQNSTKETATECTFAESLWAGDETCFSPMNVFFLFGTLGRIAHWSFKL